jgi:hypothetical protein
LRDFTTHGCGDERAIDDKAKGRMKEAAGAITGDEDKKAEKERDKHRRKDKGGLLGNVVDTLSGR